MSYALLANIHRDRKKQPNPFMPQDLIKLSFDDEMARDAHQYAPPSQERIQQLLRRFGSTIKKKDGK